MKSFHDIIEMHMLLSHNWHTGDKIMNRLAIIAPDEELALLCKEVVKQMNCKAEISIRVGATNQGVALARIEKEKGAEVIISRGGTAMMIRDEIPELPVIEIKVTAYDLIYSLNSARNLGHNVVVVGFENVIESIKGIDRVLQDMSRINIITCKVKTEEEIAEVVKSVAGSLGTEDLVFIGGNLVAEKAREIGCPSIVLQSAAESIVQAINEAMLLARSIYSEKRRTNEFKTILDHISDGVLAVNSKGEVTVYNNAAEKIMGRPKDEVLHLSVQDVIQNTRMHDVLESGNEEMGVLQEINNTTIVTNRIPILVDGKTVGAVATFQDVTMLQQLEQQVRRKLSRRGLVAKWTFADIIGTGPAMTRTIKRALKYAEVDNTILLLAETGSGKEMFAQSIHQKSRRKNGPFVAINCAALPETLLEAELFGYVEGAFTGAVKGGKAGLFEQAHGGTIFLDEIGEISKQMQTLFLRVLQEKEVRRLGDDKFIPIDVRVIAASNQNLGRLVQEGHFRSDLYYRINVLNLEIPPLRERKEDIPLLAANILKRYNRSSSQHLAFTTEALELLQLYDWPGNVRQLENVLERLIVIAEDNVITGANVEAALAGELQVDEIDYRQMTVTSSINGSDTTNRHATFNDKQLEEISPQKNQYDEGLLSKIEKETIIKVLEQVNGRRQEAARILGISSTTLWRRLKKLGID